jgi:hypothetical protein
VDPQWYGTHKRKKEKRKKEKGKKKKGCFM